MAGYGDQRRFRAAAAEPARRRAELRDVSFLKRGEAVSGVQTKLTVFLINLDRSVDRLRLMQDGLAGAKLPFERVPGIPGTALPPWLRPYFYDCEGFLRSPLAPGEIGCHAAHMCVYQRVAAWAGDGPRVALVLEDDLILPDNLRETLSAILDAGPVNWDIVRLSSIPKRAYVPIADLNGGARLVRYSKIPNYAGAYLITAAGARKLMRAGLRTLPIDEYLRRPWLNGLETYGVVPPPVTQKSFKSNIDEFGDRSLKPRSGLIRKNLEKADFKHIFKRVGGYVGALGLKRWIGCALINVADKPAKRLFGRTLIHRCAPLLKRPIGGSGARSDS